MSKETDRIHLRHRPASSRSVAWRIAPGASISTICSRKGGPDGFYELKGPPKRARIVPVALNVAVWNRLWEVSRQLTRVNVPELEIA